MARNAPNPNTPIDHHPIARALERWFATAARDLPWRARLPGQATPTREPYHALVAEFMLQQTQVSRVLEKFGPFLQRFPTIHHLARAPEGDVLAAWSGLGYYRRARLLHACAKDITDRFQGRIPDRVEDLLTLPGLGRYSAGALASIVFNHPAPIVDGNVARVLLRLEARSATPADAADHLWQHATDLARVAPRPAITNEALMELGALICTPKAPRCLHCPLGPGGLDACRAQQLGLHDRIPIPKPPARPRPIYADVLLARDAKGRVLIEQRPASGLWAGMHQAPTLESPARPPARARAKALATAAGLPTTEPLTPRDRFVHQTTHRTVHFTVWDVPAALAPDLQRVRPGSRWVHPPDLAALALSSPQRRILTAAPTITTTDP